MVLENIRVLDFGRYIAGPYCAALLADLGAEVIRIEKPEGSEDRYVCPATATGEGTLFLHINRNKRGITLDPASPRGREAVKALVRTADVVVANMPDDALRGLGLDYESLCAIKPDIILSAQTAFGAAGPYAARTGFDGVAQAMSGATYMSGLPGMPMKSYASWADFGTAIFAAYGTVAAIFHRHKTGEGQKVEADLLRTALGIFNFNNLEEYLVGKGRTPTGNRSQFGGPADLFQTRDGWIQAQVVGQGLFRRWCKMIGESHWLEDERFKTDDDRGVNGKVLSERMQAWVGGLTTEEALRALEAARIPAGPLMSPKQVFEDVHIRETGMLTPMDYPGLSKPAPMMPCPVSFSRMPSGITRRPPTLGEHNEEILGPIGFGAVCATPEGEAVI
jgi:crotonobetainyl-CoA:carnitine CoA-transferase CaiB-like acyl-CoA transferase